MSGERVLSAEQNIVEEILAVRRRFDTCQRRATMPPRRKFPVEAFGTIATGYMLIGEAPGHVSWRRQMPYSNPRHHAIREAIESLGSPRYKMLEDLFYLSDVVHCQPSPRRWTVHRRPAPTERRNGSDPLPREMELLTPRGIVTVGQARRRGRAGPAAYPLDEFAILAKRENRSREVSRVIWRVMPGASICCGRRPDRRGAFSAVVPLCRSVYNLAL